MTAILHYNNPYHPDGQQQTYTQRHMDMMECLVCKYHNELHTTTPPQYMHRKQQTKISGENEVN